MGSIAVKIAWECHPDDWLTPRDIEQALIIAAPFTAFEVTQLPDMTEVKAEYRAAMMDEATMVSEATSATLQEAMMAGKMAAEKIDPIPPADQLIASQPAEATTPKAIRHKRRKRRIPRKRGMASPQAGGT